MMWLGRAGRLAAAIALAAGTPGAALAAKPCGIGVISVLVVKGGDDGLTNRTAEAFETAFGDDEAYGLTTSDNLWPDSLIVEIPTHVARRTGGARTSVSTDILFKVTRGDVLGETRVTCAEEALEVCGQAAVEASREPVCRLLEMQLELIAEPAMPPGPPSR